MTDFCLKNKVRSGRRYLMSTSGLGPHTAHAHTFKRCTCVCIHTHTSTHTNLLCDHFETLATTIPLPFSDGYSGSLWFSIQLLWKHEQHCQKLESGRREGSHGAGGKSRFGLYTGQHRGHPWKGMQVEAAQLATEVKRKDRQTQIQAPFQRRQPDV